jgi:ABC-type branched-subunit amino acid transport system permease subunit
LRRKLGITAAILILLLLPGFIPGWVTFLLTVAFAKALVVLGIVLLMRGGLVSFGHGMFFAAGAYAVAFAEKIFNIREALILIPVALVAGLVLAAIIGLFLARYRGLFFGMFSVALSMMLYSLLLKSYWITGGTDGMRIRTVTIAGLLPDAELLRISQYELTAIIMVVALYCAYRLVRSPLGYLITAIHDNEIRVEYMGASVRQAIFRTYIVSGMLGALGGALDAFSVAHIVPDMSYWTQSGEFVFVALLGGWGSVFAPVLGSVVFEFVRNYAYKYSPYTWEMTLGAVLLIIIFFFPNGLWGMYQSVARRWPRRLKAPASPVEQPQAAFSESGG